LTNSLDRLLIELADRDNTYTTYLGLIDE
jgi:hypothetical protein